MDIYLGQCGAPEGVLAAAVLKVLDGQMETRLVCSNHEEEKRLNKQGIEDPIHKYQLNEMVAGDVVFLATGVTEVPLVNGVRQCRGGLMTQTLLVSSLDDISRIELISSTHAPKSMHRPEDTIRLGI